MIMEYQGSSHIYWNYIYYMILAFEGLNDDYFEIIFRVQYIYTPILKFCD